MANTTSDSPHDHNSDEDYIAQQIKNNFENRFAAAMDAQNLVALQADADSATATVLEVPEGI